MAVSLIPQWVFSIGKALCKKAISKMISYEIWKGTFYITLEKEPSISNFISEENLVNISKNLYNVKPHDLVNELREQLRLIDCSESDINFFVETWKMQLRDFKPEIYTLVEIDELKEGFEKVSEKVEDIHESFLSIENSVRNNIDFYNIEEINASLKKQNRTKNIIDLDYFDFADEDFRNKIVDSLSQKDELIRVSGAYTKETFFALLCVLKDFYKENYLDKVKIFKDLNSLNKIDDNTFGHGDVLVFMAGDDDIPVVKGYINIHVVSYLCEENSIKLKRRTRENAVDALTKKANFSTHEAYKIIDETNNCFPFFQRKLFNFDSNKKTKLLKNINEKYIVISLLYNGWNPHYYCDCQLIEKVTNLSVEDFLKTIKPHSLQDDPFVKEKTSHFKQGIFVISIDEQWSLFSDFVTNDIVKTFLKNAWSVLTFNKKTQIQFSDSFRHSIFDTFAFLVKYKSEFGNHIIDFFDRFFNWASREKKYDYVSSFLSSMAECEPEYVAKKIEQHVKHKYGLYSLFDGRTSYTNILWALETLMFFDSSNDKASKIVFELCKIDRTYTISNKPQETLRNILTVWVNTSPFTINQKQNLAKWMMDDDRNHAWEILESLLYGRNDTVMAFNEPKIRHFFGFKEHCENYEMKEVFKFYYELCFKNVKTIDEWCKLIEGYNFLYFDEADCFFDKLSKAASAFDDLSKFKIKKCLAKLVFKHKTHANANWALPEKYLILFEEAERKIIFASREMDYLNLFEGEVFYPNPFPYSPNSYEEYSLKNAELKEAFFNEKVNHFKNEGLSLDKLYECINEVVDVENIYGDSLLKFIILVREYEGAQSDALIEIVSNIKNLVNLKINYQILGNYKQKEFLNFFKWICDNENQVLFNSIFGSITINIDDNLFLDIYKTIPEKLLNEFWNNDQIFRLNENSKKTIDFCLERLYERSNPLFIDMLYNYKDKASYSYEECYKFLTRPNVIQMLTSSGDKYEAGEILKFIEPYYIDSEDNTVIENLIRLELIIGDRYDGQSLKFFKKSLGKSPKLYLDYIKKFYFDEKNSNDDFIDNAFYRFYNPEFAPGLINGIFDSGVFTKWVKTFKEVLFNYERGHELYFDFLGQLFANYELDSDGLPIPIFARKFIEDIKKKEDLDSFKRGYIRGKTCFKPRWVSDGEDLNKYCKSLTDYTDRLKNNGYVNTSYILGELANCYFRTAKKERDEAVDG